MTDTQQQDFDEVLVAADLDAREIDDLMAFLRSEKPVLETKRRVKVRDGLHLHRTASHIPVVEAIVLLPQHHDLVVKILKNALETWKDSNGFLQFVLGRWIDARNKKKEAETQYGEEYDSLILDVDGKPFKIKREIKTKGK